MNIIKSLTLSAALAVALTVSTLAQSSAGTGGSLGKYSWASIPLPVNQVASYSTNAAGTITTNYGLVLAGATGTNLASGWSVITTNTMTSIVWTNTGGSGFNGTFVTNTTTTYSTNTQYANFTALTDRNTALQFDGTNANSPVVLYQIAYSVDGVTFDLTNPKWLTSPGNTTFGTNMSMDGFGYGRILQITNSATATNIWTNTAAKYSIKQNSP